MGGQALVGPRPMGDPLSPVLLGQRLGLLEAHLRVNISERLVLFGFSGGFFGGFAGFPAAVSEGTFGVFEVLWRLVFVVLG